MKKFNAKQAKKLVKQSDVFKFKPLNEALIFIKQQARLGHSNTFIDGKEEQLQDLKIQLEKLGFTCYINESSQYIEIEWL